MKGRLVTSWTVAALVILTGGCEPVVDHDSGSCEDSRLKVKWDGQYIPGICKISGLRKTTGVGQLREGGDSGTTRKIPGHTEHAAIVLERAVTEDEAFEEWSDLVTSGDVPSFRKDVEVELYTEDGTLLKSWLVHDCWVSEYTVLEDFDAKARPVAIEVITIENEGWERNS